MKSMKDMMAEKVAAAKITPNRIKLESYFNIKQYAIQQGYKYASEVVRKTHMDDTPISPDEYVPEFTKTARMIQKEIESDLVDAMQILEETPNESQPA